MSSSTQATKTNILVTGATRGIGAELVQQLLAQPATTVIAAVRDINADAAQKLATSGHKNLIVIQIDSEKDEDAEAAVKIIASQEIDRIDVIIANAAISTEFNPLANVKVQDLRRVFAVNVGAPLQLFQAFRPMLEKSPNPKFLAISSIIGSLTLQRTLPYTAGSYGTSKAALNFLTLRLAIEHPDIISVAVQPGLTMTDLSREAQISIGKDIKESLEEGIAITPQQSAQAILALIQRITKADSGTFWNAPANEKLPW